MLVLITGASSGIGRALALYYLNQGATVAAVARRANVLQPWQDMAQGRLVLFPLDVTDRVAMAKGVAEIEHTLGPIDLAIASAGMAEEETALHPDLGALERTLATNVCGAFNALVPVATEMRRRGHGQIVAISSLAALQSLPRMTAYCASKAALNSGMEGLRQTLRGSGVSVTTVCPGFIATPMTEARVNPRWCMTQDRAVARIVRAIACRRHICRFPIAIHLLLRTLRLLPVALRAVILEQAIKLIVPPSPPPIHLEAGAVS